MLTCTLSRQAVQMIGYNDSDNAGIALFVASPAPSGMTTVAGVVKH